MFVAAGVVKRGIREGVHHKKSCMQTSYEGGQLSLFYAMGFTMWETL